MNSRGGRRVIPTIASRFAGLVAIPAVYDAGPESQTPLSVETAESRDPLVDLVATCNTEDAALGLGAAVAEGRCGDSAAQLISLRNPDAKSSAPIGESAAGRKGA